MFAAVGRLLANVAGPAGALLVLDDLQWAGPDALDMLGTLARAAPGVPLRLVGAYRDTDVGLQDPLSVWLADLAHADLVAHQVVEPLTATEARHLFAVAIEGLPETAVALEDRLIEKMGGVPFFVLSWAQGLRAGLPGTSVDTVPWRVAVGIHQRVAALPPPAQEALQVAAVMGRALRPALLAAITSLPEVMVLGALEGACRVRLLEETAEGYHFAHDVIREVVEEDVGLARRGLLHRKIAEYLAVLPGEPQVEVLAMHFARSDTPSRAAPYLEQAGDRAFREHAHVAAEAHYRALLALMVEPSELARAGEKLGRVLHTQGHYDAALAILEPAAGAYRLAGDLDGLARCLTQIGAVHSTRGTFVEGLALLQPPIAALEGGDPTRGLAALYGVVSDLLFMRGQFAEAVAAAERGVSTAQVLQDERLLADAQTYRGQALSRLPGRRSEALAVLEEAIRLGEANQAWTTLPFALAERARIAFHRGDFTACRHYVERAVQIAEQRGDPYQLASSLRSRGMMAFYRGDWDQACHDVERSLAICRAMGLHATSPFAPLFVAPLYLAKGDLAEAARLIEEGRLIAERTQLDDYALAVVQGLWAELDLLAGRPAEACARILPVLNAPAYTTKVEELQSLGPLLALAYLEQGEIAEATRVVERTLAQARADTALLDVIEVLRVQALIALQVGWLAQAESSLEEALPLARSMPYPYGEARLLHADGLRHRQRGDQEAARERLRASLVIFRQLGAHLDAELTEHLLAALD
jgi:tetratricopeptide (TPR) repeat protein